MSRINGSSSTVSSPLTYILNLLKMAFAGSSFHLFQLPGRRPTHSLSVVILYIIRDPVIYHHASFQRFPPHQPNPQRKS